jgi:hypothetical protein
MASSYFRSLVFYRPSLTAIAILASLSQPAIAITQKIATREAIAATQPIATREAIAFSSTQRTAPEPIALPMRLISQQPAANRAEQLLQEGLQLYQQGTLESLQQAVAKWQEALPLFRAAGDKKGEAVTLLGIGGVYSA